MSLNAHQFGDAIAPTDRQGVAMVNGRPTPAAAVTYYKRQHPDDDPEGLDRGYVAIVPHENGRLSYVGYSPERQKFEVGGARVSEFQGRWNVHAVAEPRWEHDVDDPHEVLGRHAQLPTDQAEVERNRSFMAHARSRPGLWWNGQGGNVYDPDDPETHR